MKFEKMNLVTGIYLALFGMVVLSQCSRDNLIEPASATPEPPEFRFPSKITLPEKLVFSADSMAQKIVQHAELANQIQKYSSLFAGLDSGAISYAYRNSGRTWQTNEVLDTLTICIYISENEYQFSFLVAIDGDYEGNEVDSLDFLAGSIEKASGGYSLRVSDTNNKVIEYWNWQNENQNHVPTTWISFDNHVDSRFYITEEFDGSGELIISKVRSGSASHSSSSSYQEYAITWYADGSGQWIRYDHALRLIDSGSWR
ncbi:hypothetical protein JXJ21_24775 [candidate division KSB1 bacterium]|nr:hypothetical protein [candidate division KSB1 bacterium]